MAEIYRDTSLLPGEDSNLRREILNSVGEEWLHAKNMRLGGLAPEEMLQTPDEFRVRMVLRSIKSAELS